MKIGRNRRTQQCRLGQMRRRRSAVGSGLPRSRFGPEGFSERMGTEGQRPSSRTPWRRLRKVNWVVGLIALPGLAVYMIAVVYPMIDTLYTSLFNWNILSGAHQFVGLGNYTEFFHDSTFRQAAENTAVWTVVYVPCVLAFGLLVALWLNRPFPRPHDTEGSFLPPVRAL